MNLRTSLLADQQVIDTVDGQVIRLPCLVSGFAPTSLGDATVLSKCLPVLPGLFAPHPDTVNCPIATLRERHVISRPSVHEALIELIYKAPGISDWELEEISQTEYLQTAVTAFGNRNLQVWWSSNPAHNNGVRYNPPFGVTGIDLDVPRFFGKRVMRAKGWMKYADWQAVRQNIRAALWTINAIQWGDDVDADAQGCWLFTQLITRTHDLNRTKEIELYFLNDPRGHYPIGVYRDINGVHPDGGDTEAYLRSLGPPVQDSLIQVNGLAIYSVYPETFFNYLFNFDPSEL